ncbi:FtsX-like permease family protein [candidate division KSB1 bacterium]|nr:FtsX-like permease family protein [candidate division KSB1 bacterium]
MEDCCNQGVYIIRKDMLYSVKEGFAGLFRARLSTMVTISIITLSLLVNGVFLIFTINSKKVVDSIQDRIELEVFIDNSYDVVKTDQLRERIFSIQGIKNIKYISKDQAAEIFRQQFDQDIFEILNENPLPSSFQISLLREYRTSTYAESIIEKLKALDGVDDVVFRQDILVTFEKYMNIAYIVIMSVGGLLLLGSIFLVSNTIKLTILARLELINIMKLVGATKSLIRRPFVVEGLFQGIIGSSLAILILYGILKIVNIEVNNLIIINDEIYLILMVLGVFLGLSGSFLAIQRFIKY